MEMNTRNSPSPGNKAPILYFPHGGGPLPLLGDAGHQNMIDFLTKLTPTLPKPTAVLVISAHWEEEIPTITSGAAPAIIYDYSGFPKESYEITYPAPGDPALARQIYRLLKNAGIDSRLDDRRGFDHGLYVPLKIMYPAADIPCVQLSLVHGLDPEVHLRLGDALRDLRNQPLLIIGSGFSFHNMRALDFSGRIIPDPRNESFQEWLIDTCTRSGLSSDERKKLLAEWTGAPHARYCHPREEHLLPLHVCSGIAGSTGRLAFDGQVLGKRTIAVLW